MHHYYSILLSLQPCCLRLVSLSHYTRLNTHCNLVCVTFSGPSTWTVCVFLSLAYSPCFQVLSRSLDSIVRRRCSILQTIHALLCPGGRFSLTSCLPFASHNFILAICGLSFNFFGHFRKLFFDFSWKPSSCVLYIGYLSSVLSH